ncbi:putative bifunctional diguanylate cyclase/phosphodiesterase [Vibrio japonicus]|uniref:EAL domain-containing protein n=1 Tax=Vibrio japonicus TaxID=1824638 RepID=A0ABY5LIU4_9VIBR|nr:EAL domain-containing protein [Vibrio japonicus]UUM31741.1 EAL domain-containing protein [Vibrio japonicus]
MKALIQKIFNAQDGEEFSLQCLNEIYTRYAPDHCLVAEYNQEKNIATTLVYLAQGKRLDNISYDLLGSPCEKVMNNEVMCSYSSDVQQSFPKDIVLQHLDAEGYIGVPLQAKNGQIVGVLALLFDSPIDESQFDSNWLITIGVLIGNSVLRERLTKENNKLLQQFDYSEQITDTCSWAWNVKNNLFYYSSNLTRMFNISPDRKLSFSDFFNDYIFKSDAQYQEFISQTMCQDDVSRLIVRQKECHSNMQLEMRYSKRFNDFGELEKIEGNIKNITDLSKLQLNSSVADQIIQLSDRGIMLTDQNNHIMKVNARVEEITGYNEQELQGQSTRIFSSGIHDAEFYQKMWQCIQSTGRWSGEIWNKTKSGAIYPEKLQISVVEDIDGKVTNYIAIFEDMTAHKMIQNQLARYKNKRDFTGLMTRTKFIRNLDERVDQMVVLIDICRFSSINTLYGEAFGNKVLRHVGQTLTEHFSSCSSDICRYGADQFALTLGESYYEQIDIITERIRTVLEAEFAIEQRKLKLSVNIGHSNHEYSAAECHPLTQAYYALDKAKKRPVPSTIKYSALMEQSISRKHKLGVLLKMAIAEKRLHVEYQPIFDIQENRVVKFEALARWTENGEVISPFEFIPIAEELGYIRDLGQLVLDIACTDMQRLKELGHANMRISINRSIEELNHEEINNSSILNTIHEAGLSTDDFIIEVTESIPLEDKPEVQRLLKHLRQNGLRLALDDFGTGYASFSNLMKNTVDILKIDRSLIKNIDTDKNNAVLVESVGLLANQLGLDVIAEGVETEEQLQLLKSMGCRFIQGYYISKPTPFETAINLLQ